MAEQTATLQTVPSLRSLAMNTAYKARCPQQNLFAVTSQKVSSLVHTKLAVLRFLGYMTFALNKFPGHWERTLLQLPDNVTKQRTAHNAF